MRLIGWLLANNFIVIFLFIMQWARWHDKYIHNKYEWVKIFQYCSCSEENRLCSWQLRLSPRLEQVKCRQLPIMKHWVTDPAGLNLNCLGKPLPFLWHESQVFGGKGKCVIQRHEACAPQRSLSLTAQTSLRKLKWENPAGYRLLKMRNKSLLAYAHDDVFSLLTSSWLY